MAFTKQETPQIVACTAEGDMLDGTDGLFFGTTDGYVMREDVGTSFDGLAIKAVMRLQFNQFKLPANKKRFRKLVLEMEALDSVNISFRQQFDYSDGNYAASGTQGANAGAGGGVWDASSWDTFYWSQPLVSQAEANIDGVGRNMSRVLWHESAATSLKRFVRFDAAPSSDVNDALDTLSSGLDTLQGDVNRALKLPAGTADQTLALTAGQRANLVLALDASGNLTTNGGINGISDRRMLWARAKSAFGVA
ncbi:hypothetical protein [Cupriavidus lacunae]|uniref:Uncharacterized protein n=1 Tax=Cupriavidus lacunae TaxID=2666307 RepID=A0A370NYF6_9BURK|nr:hypothetical protein [Cupriavidus lacunae]RDK10661.1 hypothetical protein DN412_08520 [Cupriavidus lacunae]